MLGFAAYGDARLELGALWLPLAGAAFGFGVASAVEGERPYLLRRQLSIPPADLAEQAVRWYAAGWTLSAAGTTGLPSSLAFTRRSAPDPLLVLVLLLCGILPGVLYLLFGGRTVTATLLSHPLPEGTELEIIVSSRAGGGAATAAGFFNWLLRLAAADDLGPAVNQGGAIRNR